MTTVLLIWILEASKLGWHSERWRKNGWLYFLHAGSILGLHIVSGSPMWMLPIFLLTVYSAGLSYTTLWTTTEEAEASWWGKPLWVRVKPLNPRQSDGIMYTDIGWEFDLECTKQIKPISDRWHVLSFLSSWPVQIAALWGMDWYWWVLAGAGAQLIWMSPLRPKGWKGSKIERFYNWKKQ